MARFIHSSDWQIGMTRAFLSDEASSRFSQARIDAITRLGELASEHAAQFIVVAGDVFESNQLSNQTLLRAINAIESLPVPVFLLPGNHDPLDGSSIFNTAAFVNTRDHVIVLRDQTPMAVPGHPDVEVVGAPWFSKHPDSDLIADLADNLDVAAGVVRIAVGHGQIDSLSPDASRPEIINLARAEQAISDGRFHYLALGDRHSVFEAGSTGRIHYSGAPLVTAFDEVDPNKALLVDIEVDGPCRVEPLNVGQWTFIAHAAAINGREDLNAFEHWLGELPNKEQTAIKVGFEGTINLANAARLDALMESGAELFASLKQRARTSDLVIEPDEFDQDSVSLSGYARETWETLNERMNQGDPVARDALRLLYRLSLREDSGS